MNTNVDLIADKLKKLPEEDKRNIKNMQLTQKEGKPKMKPCT